MEVKEAVAMFAEVTGQVVQRWVGIAIAVIMEESQLADKGVGEQTGLRCGLNLR